MSLLKCENLSFAYDGVTVVSNLNFSVEEGNYLCIIGENGAGKSTLIKGLLRLKKPSAGRVEMGEGLRATEIGYLPQQTQIQKDFPASVREVVLSGCPVWKKSALMKRWRLWRSWICRISVTGTFPAVSSRGSSWPALCAPPTS